MLRRINFFESKTTNGSSSTKRVWVCDKNVTKCHEVRDCCALGTQIVSVSMTGILAQGDRQEQAAILR